MVGSAPTDDCTPAESAKSRSPCAWIEKRHRVLGASVTSLEITVRVAGVAMVAADRVSEAGPSPSTWVRSSAWWIGATALTAAVAESSSSLIATVVVAVADSASAPVPSVMP